MCEIKVLSPQVADRIAAGEVVERPVSVVKELLENSLDAGADKIRVEILKGGSELISISDNGSGMSAEDARMSVERFATSKLREVEDLQSLWSFGFRGEALASIVAVSRFEMVTCQDVDEGGTRLYSAGGEGFEIQPVASPRGTTIRVEDLYFNTPARKKFLKSQGAETSRVIETVQHFAICHPHVQFELVSNRKTLLSFPSQMDLAQRLASIWKIDRGHLVPFESQRGELEVKGWLARPAVSKGQRSGMVIAVNHRIIGDRSLQKAICEGYQPTLPRGRFPYAFVDLKVPLEQVDVNVHPRKLEVRFLDARSIFSAVFHAVSGALDDARAETLTARDLENSLGKQTEAKFEMPFVQSPEPSPSSPLVKGSFEPLEPKWPVGSVPPVRSVLPVESEPAIKSSPSQLMKEAVLQKKTADSSGILPLKSRVSESSVSYQEKEVEPSELWEKSSKWQVEILRQVYRSYILALVNGELWLVDQHAAHERLNYARLAHVEAVGENAQKLVVAGMLSLPTELANLYKEYQKDLFKIGFEAQDMGQDNYLLQSIPSALEVEDAQGLFRDLLEELASEESSFKQTALAQRTEKLRAMVACKSSVRARDRLNPLEMKRLILDLLEVESGPYCPHGRPTRVRLDEKTLEKLFHR